MKIIKLINVLTFTSVIIVNLPGIGVAQPVLTEQQQRVEKFVLEEVKVRFGKTRSEITAKLGKPGTREMKRFANTHRPEIQDTFHRYIYSDLTIEFLELGGSGQELLYRVILKGRQYSLSWGLGVGPSRGDVTRILGEPGEVSEDGNLFTYTNFESNSTATFIFRDDRVDEIKWVMYVD